VLGAAASDPAAAAMLVEMDRQRLQAMGIHARAAAATGQLAVSEEERRDVLWSTTDGYSGTSSSDGAAGPTSATNWPALGRLLVARQEQADP
jgi:hypothetical protein